MDCLPVWWKTNDAYYSDFCQTSETMLAELGLELTTPGLTAHFAIDWISGAYLGWSGLKSTMLVLSRDGSFSFFVHVHVASSNMICLWKYVRCYKGCTSGSWFVNILNIRMYFSWKHCLKIKMTCHVRYLISSQSLHITF